MWWLLTLILAVLFGYALTKAEKRDFSAWILTFIGVLAISWVFGMIAVAVVPDLAAFMLPAETQVIGNVVVDIVGLILGLLAAEIEEVVTK
ncbi:hypothetical protein DRO69_01380 [Candidatus Bathyarchaeota archaeon]|nr:MAG: hypothetical protein DRO69_01380 [Candidatus Bathyarchaeota archaeon]